MREPKFQIGQEVYIVRDFKIAKGTILEIVRRISKTTEALEYSIKLAKVNKERIITINEAYLVTTFKEAKKSALHNWKSHYKAIVRQLDNLTEKQYNELINNDQSNSK